jgi:hypothetical protein
MVPTPSRYPSGTQYARLEHMDADSDEELKDAMMQGGPSRGADSEPDNNVGPTQSGKTSAPTTSHGASRRVTDWLTSPEALVEFISKHVNPRNPYRQIQTRLRPKMEEDRNTVAPSTLLDGKVSESSPHGHRLPTASTDESR